MLTNLLSRIKRRLRRNVDQEMLQKGASLADLKRNEHFAKIREAVRLAGTDSREHFGLEYALQGGYSLQQNIDEFTALVTQLKMRPSIEVYLEIGVASGGVCRFIKENVGFGEVISMDDGQHPRANEQQQNLAKIDRIQRFRGDSHSAAALDYLSKLNPKVDVAFVDGDHSEEGVRQDVKLVTPFVKKGGWIVLHDTIACDGVARCWLDLIRSKHFKPVAHFVGVENRMGIGIAEKN